MAGRQVFSEGKKTCLQELIIKYKLNSLNTLGAGNIAIKRDAWARLTQEFNSVETNIKRNEAQLKKLWDNLKTRKKRTLALEKRERMRTGGGSYIPMPSTSTHQPEIDAALVDCVNLEIEGVIDSDIPHYDTVEDIQVEPEKDELVEIINLPETADAEADVVLSVNTNNNRQTSGLNQTRRSGSRLSDYGSTQTHAQKNIKASAISEELKCRLENYARKLEMEEELHKLKVQEEMWLVKTAEEKYKTAKLERERAEELLKLSSNPTSNFK